MVIDFHTHIFSPRVKNDRSEYVAADPCFAALYSDKKAKIAAAEDLIENMDKEEIDISVVLNIGWTSRKLCFEANDYIMEAVNRYPKRLIGFCSVQPDNPDSALKEIERCAKGGIRGVGEIRPDIQKIDFENPDVVRPVVESITKHKMVLLTHSSEPVGHTYQGKGSVTPGILYSLVTNFPDLKLVCAHWGGGLPFYALMPEVKKALKNVYFDTAASPFLYSPQIYSQVVGLVGADKILFGSDYPLLAPGRLMKEIDSLELPTETRAMIVSGNAKKLLEIW
jgi:uncharacterized protein